MKKRIMLLGILSIISLGIIAGYNYLNHKDDVKYNLKESNIAIMVYDDEIENYVKQSNVPKGAKYSLNEELTRCEFGGTVTDYSKSNGTLKYELDTSDKCYVYFDVDNTPSYAIYSETDNSLIFYKNNDTVGEEYNGRVVTAKYDDVEELDLTYDLSTTVTSAPWYEYADDIKLISVLNVLQPISTEGWFYYLINVESINLLNLDTSEVTSMAGMFDRAGINSSNFSLNLGDKFDTSKVTNMKAMFNGSGYMATDFVLDLGDKFDTCKVTNMASMFQQVAQNSTNFQLDLGDKFDTSKVTNMYGMFNCLAYEVQNFQLDLGDKFDTSKVIDMSGMFRYFGKNSENLYLNLGSKFDTSQVTNMSYMFFCCGMIDSDFELNLGSKFDTSSVINMMQMFQSVGKENPNFTLVLGDLFDTTNVINMYMMFAGTGYANSSFELDVSGFVINSNCDLQRFAENTSSKIIFGEGWSNATLVSGMFKCDNSKSIEIVNAPANILAYDFAADNRIVSFTTI